MTELDEDQGKIFWPIKEGDHPSIEDAYYTLYSLSDAMLMLTFYDETGNVKTRELFIEFADLYEPGTFARMTLKELLEETLEYVADVERYEDESEDAKYRTRVIKRLIQVLEEEK